MAAKFKGSWHIVCRHEACRLNSGVMRSIIAIAMLAALPLQSQADCLPAIDGWVKLQATVNSCKVVRAPRPALGSYLKLKVSGVTASVAGCTGGCEGVEYYQSYLRALESQSHIFVSTQAATCKTVEVGKSIPFRVSVQCCDTLPHQGLCRFRGPLAVPCRR